MSFNALENFIFVPPQKASIVFIHINTKTNQPKASSKIGIDERKPRDFVVRRGLKDAGILCVFQVF